MDFGASEGGLQPATSYDSPVKAYMPTLKDRLSQAVRDAESRLADAQRAKEIFTAHPELEELLNIMQRGRF